MPFTVFPTAEFLKRLAVLNTGIWNKVGEVAKIHLYKNDVSPDINSTRDSFTEATFTGYMASALVMGAPSINDQGLANVKSALQSWTSAPGDPEETVYGFYITDDENDALICAQRFDEPQQMGGPYPQAISGVFRVSEPLSNFGWIDVEV